MIVLAYIGMFAVVLIPGLLLVHIFTVLNFAAQKKDDKAMIKKLETELKEAKKASGRPQREPDAQKQDVDMTPPAARQATA